MKKLFWGSVVCCLSMWSLPAMAYIDPGSGSAIMSAIIGFFLAVSIAVKTYWYKLKAFFNGSKSEKIENSEPKDQD